MSFLAERFCAFGGGVTLVVGEAVSMILCYDFLDMSFDFDTDL